MLAVLFFASFSFAGYEKIDEKHLKETEQVTQEKVYNIDELKNDKERLEGEIATYKERSAERLKEMQNELDKIKAVIQKAKELGIE